MDAKSPKSGRSPGSLALGATVRRRRKLLGLTQVELAELAPCDESFLRDVERGKPTLRLDKLVAVLTALSLQLTLSPGSEGIGIADEL